MTAQLSDEANRKEQFIMELLDKKDSLHRRIDRLKQDVDVTCKIMDGRCRKLVLWKALGRVEARIRQGSYKLIILTNRTNHEFPATRKPLGDSWGGKNKSEL